LLAALTGTLLLALLATRYAFRFGVPIILFFILAGILAGSEGLGGIEFEDYGLAQVVGTLALVVILFDGGFHTDAKLFRLGLRPALILAVFGTAATAFLVAVFAVWALGFGWLEGLVLGSVVSSTDAAAVFASLRKQNLVLKKRIQAVLEIESGSNDPPAVYLTVAFTALLLRGEPPGASIALGFVLQMALGLAAGYLGGRGAGWLLRGFRLEWPSLYPLVLLVLAMFIYACANLAGGSGFLAVYVAGVVLGNQPLPFKPLVSRFHDGMSWLMQLVMFVLLGLLVFPSRLLTVAGPGMALALFLIFAARPLVTTLLLTGSGLHFRERLLVAWGGLRGAVPIILAIHPLTQGVERGHLLFNIVFFVVMSSVLLQGATVGWVARRLGLLLPGQHTAPVHVELAGWHIPDGNILLFQVLPGAPVEKKALRDLPLPPETLALLLVRGDRAFPPRGSTVLETGDFVYVFAAEKDKAEVETLFAAPGAA
jgi:cell volume regulation protein A